MFIEHKKQIGSVYLMVVLKNVQEKAQELGFDIEKVKSEIRRVQSVKCRLLKQKAKPTYETEMTQIIKEEQLLKEVRSHIEPRKITATTMTSEDIALLNFDETIKAIKSIQSKKCNTQYLTENVDENIEYQDAIRIEKLLLEHKKTVKPIEDTVVKKSDINELIQHLENQQENVSKEYIIEKLKELLA